MTKKPNYRDGKQPKKLIKKSEQRAIEAMLKNLNQLEDKAEEDKNKE